MTTRTNNTHHNESFLCSLRVLWHGIHTIARPALASISIFGNEAHSREIGICRQQLHNETSAAQNCSMPATPSHRPRDRESAAERTQLQCEAVRERADLTRLLWTTSRRAVRGSGEDCGNSRERNILRISL